MTWVPRSFQRRMALARDGAACRYCGRRVWPRHMVPKDVWLDVGLTFDHFFPRVRSGPSEVWNLFVSCYRCNSAKAHTPPVVDDLDPAKRTRTWRLLPAPAFPQALTRWHAGIARQPWPFEGTALDRTG